MRVLLYFSGHLFAPKGTPIRTRNMMHALMVNGAEVFFAGHDAPENIPHEHTLFLTSPITRGFQLVSFVRKNKIDIVYFQTSAGLWFAPLVALFTGAKVGVDFHSRRFQEEHVYQKRSQLHTAFMEATELGLCRFLSFGTSVSHKLTEYYAPAIKNILTLPVGVDLTLFSPNITPNKDIASWKGEGVLLAYAGNTKWYQGVEIVLGAFKRLHTVYPGMFKFLVIASSGIDTVKLYATQNGLENSMYILDKQPHEAIPALLASADILTVVRPSEIITEYSFPSKLSEYAALGKALIVSRVGDIGSYITDHENGLIINPSDSEGLYHACEELKETELRTRLGKAVRKLAEKEFNLAVLGSLLYSFLQGLYASR